MSIVYDNGKETPKTEQSNNSSSRIGETTAHRNKTKPKQVFPIRNKTSLAYGNKSREKLVSFRGR
ncbi:hypothetical protein KSZ_38440 [Dictyobacter formicarum]|uniref:Uncharacterized protein n=1 Tax=Dictyobacter formicarum TaxID=2778368 RepID=A0ABQ3VJR0_9CHLR|nr:hypothetical protein KSZ_38440 [Dictyobacter formicarum]